MSVLKRLAAVYMLLVAVAMHFLATQLYDPMLDGTALTVWRVLDPLMMVGVVAALIAAFARKPGWIPIRSNNLLAGSICRRTSRFTTQQHCSSGFSITGSVWSMPILATTRD